MTDKDHLFAALKDAGGVANNRTTRLGLRWDWDRYSSARGQLIDDGVARSQRGGPGGSTAIIEPIENLQADLDETAQVPENVEFGDGAPETERERDLYQPVLEQLQGKWAEYEKYDNIVACDTSSQGRRDTGGKWTRPDITVVAVKKFKFLPEQHFEIVTFEVKAKSQMGVEGVFEALSHRHSVHRSYLVIHASPEEFEVSREADRVTQLLQRHEVGLYLAEDPSDFETWVEYVSAPRWEPDPFQINAFLQNVMPVDHHDKIITLLK